jgi:polyisoprenoid-binding protein YceI
MLLLSIKVHSQDYTLNKTNSTITVSGTSSLHDWDVISNNFNGKIQLKDFTTGEIESLNVTITAETLKSGKNAMDKKTYKALQTDEFKTIGFKMVEVKAIKKINESSFEIKLIGAMTISGVTKKVPIDFLLSKVNDTVNVTGTYAMKMTDFNIEPPTALFGTINTGDEISINFNANFKN